MMVSCCHRLQHKCYYLFYHWATTTTTTTATASSISSPGFRTLVTTSGFDFWCTPSSSTRAWGTPEVEAMFASCCGHVHVLIVSWRDGVDPGLPCGGRAHVAPLRTPSPPPPTIPGVGLYLMVPSTSLVQPLSLMSLCILPVLPALVSLFIAVAFLLLLTLLLSSLPCLPPQKCLASVCSVAACWHQMAKVYALA